MKISVIVPVYNTEKYLRNCLDTLTKQLIDDYEIIIVDDGSTDGSLAIAKEYKKLHENIKCYTAVKQEGVSQARNFGLLKAKGDYIFFCDSDDYIDVTMLDKMYRGITDTNAEIAVCNICNVYEGGEKEAALSLPKEKILSNDDYQLVCRILNGNVYLANGAANKLYRSDFLKSSEAVFEDTKKIYAEDACFNYLLYAKVNKICVIDEPLYYYRCDRKGSITNSYKPDLCNRIKYLITRIMDCYHQLPQYETLYPGIQKKSFEFFMELLYNECERKMSYRGFRKVAADEFFTNLLKGLDTSSLSKPRKTIYYLHFLKMYFFIYIIFYLKKKGVDNAYPEKK